MISSKSYTPNVSIGLPVYNGERFLAQTLDSILAQTYSDFELIISDNGSIDGTESICKQYARKDRRIRYIQHNENKGGAWNYNYVFSLSKGRYFKWAAHDDVLKPTFMESCVDVLERNSAIVLAYTETIIINGDGDFDRDLHYNLSLDAPSAHARYAEFHKFFLRIQNFHCNPVFGVVRAEVLRNTSLIGSYLASDKVLLAELALHGQFFRVPEYAFLRRDHSDRAMLKSHSQEERASWFDPANRGKEMYPNWRWLREYLRAINNAPLAYREKILCYLITIRSCRGRRLVSEARKYIFGSQVLSNGLVSSKERISKGS